MREYRTAHIPCPREAGTPQGAGDANERTREANYTLLDSQHRKMKERMERVGPLAQSVARLVGEQRGVRCSQIGSARGSGRLATRGVVFRCPGGRVGVWGCSWHLVNRSQDAAEYPAAQNDSAPSANSAEAQKPWRGRASSGRDGRRGKCPPGCFWN